MNLTNYVNLVDIISNVVQTAAIVIAGLWTYALFVRGRQHSLRADFKQKKVTDVDLGQGQRYLQIKVQLKNIGNVALYPWNSHASVQQILPLTGETGTKITSRLDPAEPDGEFPWELVVDRDVPFPTEEGVIIEPGESMAWQFDFLIPSSVQVAQLHTMVYCDKSDAEQYWDDACVVRFYQPTV
jgi:hypothetical protein